MFKTAHKWWANLTGSNTQYTPVEAIRDQLNERRPLPIGSSEWVAFVDRISSGHCIPGLTRESTEFAIADQILHLGPLEDFKEDAFFIHALRKCAVNQTAVSMREESRNAVKAKLAAQAEQAKATAELVKPSEVTPTEQGVTDETKDASA